MTGATGRRVRRTRAARRAETLDRLLAAAGELTGNGRTALRAVPVEALATRAGISRATFYIYFEDKAALVRAWFAGLVDQLAASGERWWGAAEPVAPAVVGSAIRDVLVVYRRNRTVLAAVGDMVTLDPELRELVGAADARRTEVLTVHIRRGQEGGWIDGSLLADETAQWLSVMIDRVATGVVVADDESADALADAGAVVIWRTLYARAAA